MNMISADFAAALRRITSRDMLVVPETADELVSKLAQYQAHDPSKVAEIEAASRSGLALAYGYDDEDSGDRKPFVFQDGVAVIPIHGTLINRFNGSWGFVTGYNYVRRMMNLALDDSDVDAIVYDVDSPGGEAAGCFELGREIMASRRVKPSLAMVDSLCASGGIALGACPTKIYAIPSARIGSIGVYRMHMSIEKMLKNEGIKVTFASAGDHKIDGNPYEDLPQAVLDEWKEAASKTWDDFISLVAEARDMDEADVRATQARIYRADEALALGLIDAVKTPTEAVAAFLAELADDDPSDSDDGEDEMTDKAKGTEVTSAVDYDKIGAMIGTAVGNAVGSLTRKQNIAAHGKDKGQVALAARLAGNDAITEADAIAMIDDAASAAKPAKVKTKVPGQRAGASETDEDADDDGDADDDDGDADADEDEEEKEPASKKASVKAKGSRDSVNHFDRAMTNSRHPNAGAGKGKGASDEKTDSALAAGILADHHAVAGADWSKKAANQ